MSAGTGSLRKASQGLPRPFLNFLPNVFPDSTDRPWVSEDDDRISVLCRLNARNLGCVHTIPDSFCAGLKIIPDGLLFTHNTVVSAGFL